MNNILHINSDNKNNTNTTWCYSASDNNKLIFDIIESAKTIHTILKPGLPKCVYQLKLYNDLLKKGFQLQTEMSSLNIAVRQETARELIIVNECLIIECIVESEINDHYHKKIMFDLENNGYAKGLLINFSDEMQSDMVTTINHCSVFH